MDNILYQRKKAIKCDLTLWNIKEGGQKANKNKVYTSIQKSLNYPLYWGSDSNGEP